MQRNLTLKHLILPPVTPDRAHSRKSPMARFTVALAFLTLLTALLFTAPELRAESTAFKKAVAQAAAQNKIISAFYKARNYEPIWFGGRNNQRRRAFLDALSRAPAHGLPLGRYDAAQVRAALSGFKSAKERGKIEVQTTRQFLQYARDIQSGILEPRKIDENMTLRPPRRDPLALLQAISKGSASAFLRKLPPQTADYQGLLKEKRRMEQVVARGGWGPKVSASKLKVGSSGKAVVALRKRLSKLGYPGSGVSSKYDKSLVQAVARFQRDYGLVADGVAGKATLAAINTSATTRLMQTVIGLERVRWLNKTLGKRHILVNEAAFTAQIFDKGRETFLTRVVVGQAGRWRTPEFEKKMTHMIVNPSWYVPASIAGLEDLPLLKESNEALTRQDLVMTDDAGQVVNPRNIDFSGYTKDNFPYSLRQPPSGANALGKVKFLFPNKHAIYLHDTPAKRLFGYDSRMFSHGCVRVEKPDELAYALLSRQTQNPKKVFDDLVASGEETRVNLKEPVPIYLVYRTVFVDKTGRARYRADGYNVDGKVFKALTRAGVRLRALKS